MKSIRSCKVLTLVSLATVLGALAAFAAEEVREEFHQTYPLNKQGRVQLENVNGNVHIATWDREEIKVDAIKHAKKQEHPHQNEISRCEDEAEQKQFNERGLHAHGAEAEPPRPDQHS